MEPPSIERVSIWILEVLEEERQREPDWLKCRPSSQVLGALKTKHSLDDAGIKRGLDFCLGRGWIKVLNREDGQAMLPSDDGIRMFAQIELHRLDEREKKKRSRADKIALAGLVIGVILFFLGYYLGDHNAKKSDNTPTPQQQTNSIPTSSPKLP